MPFKHEWTAADFSPPPRGRSIFVPSDPWRQPLLRQPQTKTGPIVHSAFPNLARSAKSGGSSPNGDPLVASLDEQEVWIAELRARCEISYTTLQRSGTEPHAPSALVWAEVPDLDPQARQAPWRLYPPEPSARNQARRKAARLALALELTSASANEATLVWLTDFFEEHPAPATFAAIVRGVLSGVDLDQLKLMAALKELWAQTPEWWSVRVFCRLRHRFVFRRARAGPATLSWALAARICDARGMYPADAMIDEDWIAEWQTEAPRIRCNSFARYVAWRIERPWPDQECFLLGDAHEPSGTLRRELLRLADGSHSLADLISQRPALPHEPEVP